MLYVPKRHLPVHQWLDGVRKFGDGHRLSEETINAQFWKNHVELLPVNLESGEEADFDAFVNLPDLPAELEAAHLRHANVDHYEIICTGPEIRKCYERVVVSV